MINNFGREYDTPSVLSDTSPNTTETPSYWGRLCFGSFLLQGNKTRDRFVNRELRKMGWVVVRVWEHELKSPEKVVAKLRRQL